MRNIIQKLACLLTAAAVALMPSAASADVVMVKAAEWSLEQGIITNREVLNGRCSKGMLATTLWVAKGMPASSGQYMFSDASGYILMAEQWAVETGVMRPVSEGQFGTEAVVSRREVAETTWLAAGTPAWSEDVYFTDVPYDDHSYPAVKWAAGRKVMEGYTDHIFAPDATCTGLQMTSAVYRSTIGGATRQQFGSTAEYWANGAFSAVWEGNATHATHITREQLVSAAARVTKEARERGYRYGNSSSTPPTDDGLISCDRLIAKALWYLGFTDQTRGGITCGNMASYLINHGWICSNNVNDIGYGSILLVKHANPEPYWAHCFMTIDFDPYTWTMTSLDQGTNGRITGAQVQPEVNRRWYYYKGDFLVFNLPSP